MKYLYLLFFISVSICTSQQAYYTNGENNLVFTLTGEDMYNALQTKISNNTNTDTYTYGAVRDDFKIMELDPTDPSLSNVLLTYGFVNSLSCSTDDTDSRNNRLRNKNDFGGSACDYNREHVFARSNANPTMGSVSNSDTGIAADPHNLRATDVNTNSTRGNRNFGSGSGNSGVLGNGDYYPGDEWKGDVARIMMYMYVRYGDRCLPEFNASGPKEGTTDMLQLLLQWNAEDMVSAVEDNRNTQLESVYGNRNPFIDNPALATIIWGGPNAEDRWGNILSTSNFQKDEVKIYPNPASGNEVSIITNKNVIVEVFDVLGKRIKVQSLTSNQKKLDISALKKGIYLLRLQTELGTTTKKLIRQ